MINQPLKLAPPLPSDVRLLDYTQGVNLNLGALFAAAHTHSIQTVAPTSTQGSLGDITIVNLSGTFYLYVKGTSTQWYKVALTAA